jgi:membrane-anchored protein YejM (alkaline phosphatase superfamily)
MLVKMILTIHAVLLFGFYACSRGGSGDLVEATLQDKEGVIIRENDLEGLNIEIPLQRKVRGPVSKKKLRDFLDSTTFNAKHLPDIYILFNDTWRRDHVIPKLMPNVSKFKEEAVSPQSAISGATATYHSTFSILNSLPSYLSYPYIRGKYAELGSLPVNILVNKLGYQIHIDTWGTEIECMDEILSEDGNPNLKNYRYDYQLNFAYKMKLIHECKTSKTLGNSHVVHQTVNPNSAYKSFADMDLALYKSALARTRKNTSGHHFYYIHTMAMHDPYSWRDDVTDLFEPNQFEENSDSPNVLANSYKNAAKSFDKSFGDFIAGLKAANKYDDALIFVFGDHGESLGEQMGDKRIWMHGSRSYHNRISIPWMIKFPGDNSELKKNLESVTVSASDIMPTILDYLGLENYGQEFYWGKSLLSKEIQVSNRNSINVRPNKDLDSFEMALLNSTYKIIVRIQKGDDTNVLNADGFHIVSITNLFDRPIESSEKFAKFELVKGKPVKHYNEFVEMIKTDFAQSLEYLFPSN